jgi:hypothetical protein
VETTIPALLEPLGEAVEQRVRRDGREQRPCVGREQRTVPAEQAQVEERRRGAQLPPHQPRARGDREHREEAEPQLGVDQEEQERHQRHGERHDADEVDPRGEPGPGVAPGPGLLRQPPRPEDQAGQRERDIDGEGRVPAADGDEQPSQGRADDRDGLGGDGEDRQDGLRALPTGALRLAADEVHRGRIAGARPEPDEHAREDEDAERGGQGPDHAADPDEDRAHEVEPPRAVEVDQPPDHGLADRGRQVEPGDQPRRLRGRCPERDPDRHQGDGQHRGVDRVEDRAEDHRHDQPAVESLAVVVLLVRPAAASSRESPHATKRAMRSRACSSWGSEVA